MKNMIVSKKASLVGEAFAKISHILCWKKKKKLSEDSATIYLRNWQ